MTQRARLMFVSRIAAVTGLALLAAGCTTMGTTQTVSSVSKPVMAAPVQVAASAPIVAPQGADFSTAVAMIAQTPGTGVRAVGKAPDTVALALAPTPTANSVIDQAVRQSAPQKSSPAKSTKPAAKPAPAPVTPPPPPERTAELEPAAPVTCVAGVPVPGCVPAKTVFNEPVTPIRRF